MAIWEIEGDTSWEYCKMKLRVTYDPSTALETQDVTLQLYIKFTLSNHKRYQHDWEINYQIDDGVILNKTLTSALPDKNTGIPNASVAAYVYPKKNEWYPWGGSVKVTMLNKGYNYKFAVTCRCKETKPASNRTVYMWKQMPRYTVIPTDPSGLTVSYNEITEEVTYSISSTTNANEYIITRDLYDENSAYIKTLKDTVPATQTSFKETISDTVCSIKWSVQAISSTNDYSQVKMGPDLIIYRYSPFWVKHNGVWKKTKVWVRTQTGWKLVTKIYYMKG